MNMNEVFEKMEVDIRSKKWTANHRTNQPLSDDSDCISDRSENLTKISEKIVDNSQISALNGRTKQCAIYFIILQVVCCVRVMYDWFERCTY